MRFVKDQQMHHTYNILVLKYTPTCCGIIECHHQGIRYEHAKIVTNVVGSREGWELCILSDDVVVGVLLGEGSLCKSGLFSVGHQNTTHFSHWAPSPRNIPIITPSVTIYSSHPSLLPATLRHHLSMFISGSLMMAF
jgi:hypothetical protein